jgi:hypothetical protein
MSPRGMMMRRATRQRTVKNVGLSSILFSIPPLLSRARAVVLTCRAHLKTTLSGLQPSIAVYINTIRLPPERHPTEYMSCVNDWGGIFVILYVFVNCFECGLFEVGFYKHFVTCGLHNCYNYLHLTLKLRRINPAGVKLWNIFSWFVSVKKLGL